MVGTCFSVLLKRFVSLGRRSPPPERPFSVKTDGAAEFTPQYLSTALALWDRGRATPPHRQNYLSAALLGKGLQVQTRDYTYEPRLCQARAAPSPDCNQKLRPSRALS